MFINVVYFLLNLLYSKLFYVGYYNKFTIQHIVYFSYMDTIFLNMDNLTLKFNIFNFLNIDNLTLKFNIFNFLNKILNLVIYSKRRRSREQLSLLRYHTSQGQLSVSQLVIFTGKHCLFKCINIYLILTRLHLNSISNIIGTEEYVYKPKLIYNIVDICLLKNKTWSSVLFSYSLHITPIVAMREYLEWRENVWRK